MYQVMTTYLSFNVLSIFAIIANNKYTNIDAHLLKGFGPKLEYRFDNIWLKLYDKYRCWSNIKCHICNIFSALNYSATSDMLALEECTLYRQKMKEETIAFINFLNELNLKLDINQQFARIIAHDLCR